MCGCRIMEQCALVSDVTLYVLMHLNVLPLPAAALVTSFTLSRAGTVTSLVSMNYCLAFLASSLSRAHHRPRPLLSLLPSSLHSLTHSPVSRFRSFLPSLTPSLTLTSLPPTLPSRASPRPPGIARGPLRRRGAAPNTFKRPLVILKHCGCAMERDPTRLTTHPHLSFPAHPRPNPPHLTYSCVGFLRDRPLRMVWFGLTKK